MRISTENNEMIGKEVKKWSDVFLLLNDAVYLHILYHVEVKRR